MKSKNKDEDEDEGDANTVDDDAQEAKCSDRRQSTRKPFSLRNGGGISNYLVSKKKKKLPRKKWTSEQMAAAIDLVLVKKKTLKYAATKFDLPFSTLHLHLNKQKDSMNS